MIEVKFSWDKTFAPRWNRKFTAMQAQLDKSCMKYMTQYTPVGEKRFHNSGHLRDSISNPEPGRIIYPGGPVKNGISLAREKYYDIPRPKNHLRSGNPQATSRWFETMKAKDLSRIRREVAQAGGFKK
jgi:hypothetical protein